MNSYTTESDIICLGDLTIDRVDWLWKPYIPLGKVTILQGDPGEGKTTLALHLAALVSRGMMYGSEKVGTPQRVLYLTAEDGIRDTILPRLARAHANCKLVYSIYDGGNPITIGDSRLIEAIDRYQPALVIIDPLQAFLGADVNMHRANEIRPVMAALSQIAYRYCCAVVLIGHMNKQMGNKSLYRGLGSIDLTASARSVLMMARDPREQDVRVLLHLKSSLAKEGKPQAFRVDEKEGLLWEGDYEGNLQALVTMDSAIATESRLEEAIGFLKEALADGEMPSKELNRLAEEQDFCRSTLIAAKRKLGVRAKKRKEGWFVSLPVSRGQEVEEVEEFKESVYGESPLTICSEEDNTPFQQPQCASATPSAQSSSGSEPDAPDEWELIIP